MKPRAPSKELADVREKVELSATIVLVSDLSVVVPSEGNYNSSVSTPSRTLKTTTSAPSWQGRCHEKGVYV